MRKLLMALAIGASVCQSFGTPACFWMGGATFDEPGFSKVTCKWFQYWATVYTGGLAYKYDGAQFQGSTGLTWPHVGSQGDPLGWHYCDAVIMETHGAYEVSCQPRYCSGFCPVNNGMETPKWVYDCPNGYNGSCCHIRPIRPVFNALNYGSTNYDGLSHYSWIRWFFLQTCSSLNFEDGIPSWDDIAAMDYWSPAFRGLQVIAGHGRPLWGTAPEYIYSNLWDDFWWLWNYTSLWDSYSLAVYWWLENPDTHCTRPTIFASNQAFYLRSWAQSTNERGADGVNAIVRAYYTY